MDKFSKCHCLRFLAFEWEGCVPLGRQIRFIPAAKLLICSSFLKYCVEDSEAVYRLSGKDLCIINNSRGEHGGSQWPQTCPLLVDSEMLGLGGVSEKAYLWLPSLQLTGRLCVSALWSLGPLDVFFAIDEVEMLAATICWKPVSLAPHGNICSRVF